MTHSRTTVSTISIVAWVTGSLLFGFAGYVLIIYLFSQPKAFYGSIAGDSLPRQLPSQSEKTQESGRPKTDTDDNTTLVEDHTDSAVANNDAGSRAHKFGNVTHMTSRNDDRRSSTPSKSRSTAEPASEKPVNRAQRLNFLDWYFGFEGKVFPITDKNSLSERWSMTEEEANEYLQKLKEANQKSET